MSEDLQFDPAAHAYTWKGRPVPSVTQILDVLDLLEGVPYEEMKAAGEFGQHVHHACHLLDQGRLDLEALDPELKPYVDRYAQFLMDSGVVVIASETIEYHREYEYAGGLDRKVIFPKLTVPSIMDIKTSYSVPASVGPQTAAYRELERARGRQTTPTRYCLHLRPDSYRLIKLAWLSDFNVFVSCRTIWRFKHGY